MPVMPKISHHACALARARIQTRAGVGARVRKKGITGITGEIYPFKLLIELRKPGYVSGYVPVMSGYAGPERAAAPR